MGSWVLKSINQKQITINRTPLDIPLLLFLGANILSTIFSIDPHTSIWGYYSRSNGGLLSIISYLLLYWAFVSNIKKDQIKTLFKFAFASGLIISIWGILEHFGVSLSCVILRGQFNADCWVQDVQARVFASLGQPNWMAAYLSMLIFPALFFLLTSKSRKETIYYFLITILYYLAFTFTYSRGPTLGLIGGLIIFLLCFYHISTIFPSKKLIFLVLGAFIIINILFGSALTSFRLVSKFASPARPGISLPSAPQTGTQLENGGTESGQIRFIVWKGALDIFSAYPIFGSGVETFAYSYYQFRPTSHNLTSEWDFLYNKAHNEYLNYLSTTGIVGIGTYLLLIGTFLVYSLLFIVNRKSQKPYTIHHLLLTSLLASYISYLIYNFFLFSVVIIAVFFYLYPAVAFVATSSLKSFSIKIPANKWTRLIVFLFTLYLLYSIIQLWYGDVIFARAQKASDLGNPVRAYNLSYMASVLNPREPLFRSEFGYIAANAANALKDNEATLSARLKKEAAFETEKVLKSNPKNVSFWKTAIRTYFELSTLDPSFINKAIEAVDKAISLAPSDPKLYYNKALILKSMGKNEDSIEQLKKALEFKPDYLEAKAELEE